MYTLLIYNLKWKIRNMWLVYIQEYLDRRMGIITVDSKNCKISNDLFE